MAKERVVIAVGLRLPDEIDRQLAESRFRGDQLPQPLAGAHPVDLNPVISQPADHVHIEDADQILQGNRGVGRPMLGAQHAHLFGVPPGEQHRTPGGCRKIVKACMTSSKSGRTAGIVIRPVVDVPDRSEAVPARAVSNMVVVSTDQTYSFFNSRIRSFDPTPGYCGIHYRRLHVAARVTCPLDSVLLQQLDQVLAGR